MPGRVVWVTNGVYDVGGAPAFGVLTNRVALTNAVTVRSMNGPAVTVLRGAPGGDDAVRCAYVGNGSVLSGFTLTNGYTRALGDSKERGGGGALCQRGGVITNCVIVGNSAQLDGGGVNGGTLFDCTLAGNEAQDDGGGADGAVLVRCLLLNNRSVNGGGGADESVLHECTLLGNASSVGGGADDCTLFDSTLQTNNATYAGGGVYNAVLDHCVFVGNSASVGGGATSSTAERCTFIGNLATNGMSRIGGGAAHSLLVNCVLRGNTAVQGGGAFTSDLHHCTIVDNEALSEGGGVAGGSVNNSLVHYNSAPNGPNHSTAMAPFGFPINYTSTTPLPVGGAGNITAEPIFMDRAGGDFRLRPGSPGIDAGGITNATMVMDLAGLQRPLDGNRDGIAGFDMGAFEFNPLFFTAMTRVGNNVRICWFDTVVGMQLQAAPSLSNPAWTNVPLAPGSNCVEVPAGMSNAVFRLIKP